LKKFYYSLHPLKKLFGQTAVYGFGTVVPRLLNYVLLTPFFTRVFEVGEYGVVTELYAYVVFLMIILTYGLETGFFRFAQVKKNIDDVFSTSLISLIFTSGIFILLLGVFSNDIANIIGYSSNPEYVIWIGLIVGIDATMAIPFARLRWENKALKFAIIKIAGVIINIGLNFLFLYFIPRSGSSMPLWMERIYSPSIGVGYVFISNLIASGFTLILLLGTISKVRINFNLSLWKDMLKYSYPLLISGLAGTVNEALDRVLLKHLIPDQVHALEQLGIYGANYKIAVLMTLFIQMFRYASEPFYFGQADKKNAIPLFATVMKYFVLAGLCIFLMVSFYIEIFKYFIGSNFHEGLKIVPIILFANLLLGVFFNLSIWYKLNNLTKYGAIITLIGAGITFIINWFLIPVYGYIASAWAHVACYGSMVLISWFLGRKFYPVPYQVLRILAYILVALILYGLAAVSKTEGTLIEILKNTVLLAVFIIIVFLFERKSWSKIKAGNV
jgi:O-antigen/teichoic acid export membrane protein